MSAGDNPSIAQRLAERSMEHPGRLAIVSMSSRLTFGAMADRVARFAERLVASGVRAGDRVLIFVPMSAELYVALLGAMHAGAIATFVDAWADRRRIDAAVRAAAPRAFVGTPRAHLLRLSSAALRAVPVAFLARRGLGGRDPIAPGAAPPPAAIITADDPALITFTTGSTGQPKAAARSHGFLWAQHEVLAAHLGLRETDIDMPTLPIFVLNNLAAGIPSVLPQFDPRRPAEVDAAAILAQMERERVTTASGSPAFFDALCRHASRAGRGLPLRAYFTGGAPVPPAQARRFAAFAPTACHVLYGSTEAEPIAALEAGELARLADERPGAGLCAGAPIAEIRLRIVRPHDGPLTLGPAGWGAWDLPRGQPGEIVVSGAHVLRGYWNDPESDRENKVPDGARVWHRTGDGGFLDERGRLWLVGRVKHRVQRAGATWWGVPVELRAMAVPGITHAAYFGTTDAALGQRAVLCVEGAGASDPALLDRVRAAAAPAPVDELVSLPRIPRDPRHASKTDVEALFAKLGARR